MAYRGALLAAVGIGFALATTAVQAHFRLDTAIRIVHLERLDEGLRLSMRLPATLAFAEYAGAAGEGGDEGAIPWVVDAVENGGRMHYLDSAAIAADASGFAAFVAAGYRLTADGEVLSGKAVDMRIHAAERQTRFTTLAEVDVSFAGPPLPASEALYVGDAVIDVRVRYPAPAATAALHLSSTLSSTLQADAFVANLLIGYDGGEQRIDRITGQLAEPVEIAPTRLSAAKSFMGHGLHHILAGPDHLLFVLCLAIGAGTPGVLLWRVSGFTVGHTISLAAGVAGYAPEQPWLVAAVEVLIALSIVYAATRVLRRASREYTLAVTTSIGILHGLGFSMLLSQLLGADSPHLVTSLLSFNAGIEIGQVLVVLVVLAFLFALGRISTTLRAGTTNVLASVSLAVAVYWVLQRVPALWGVA